MKHIDGITVYLRELNEERIKEYDNGADNAPHPDFRGSLGTRQIAVRERTYVEAIIQIEESFNLYTADGVWIEVYSGCPIGPLSASESGQCWWIDGREGSITGAHKVSFWSLWGDEGGGSKMIRFSVPAADKGQ